MHVVVDAGHGGMDTGAVRGAARESSIVLEIAKKLENKLRTHPELTVTMTRNADKAISLAERVRIANNLKADLFLSLHANTAGDARAKGFEFYFQNNLPPDEDSLYLAAVENQIIKVESSESNLEPSKKGDIISILDDLKRQHRIESSLKASRLFHQKVETKGPSSIKQAPFYVISKTQMPSVLIEVGFLSNPKEVKKLMSSEYQEELSNKIFQAILEYKEKMDKGSLSALN